MTDARNHALQNAVKNLYATFARYPLPRDTGPCPCGCNSEANVRRLISKPLRELTPLDLSAYACSAMLTWGDSLVLRHFLPRLFEVVSDDEEFRELAVNPEIVLSKPRLADWLTWPAEEQQAIRNFFHALWAVRRVQSLEEYPDFDEPNEEWLCAIAQSEPTLNPYLDAWLCDPNPAASASLIALTLRSGIIPRSGCNGFWDKIPERLSELREWLLSEQVKHKLLQARQLGLSEADQALALLG